MSTATERFEAIGDLYCRRHHRLRPGKSEAPETYRDSGSEENHQLFDNWIATGAFTDTIERIIALESEVKMLRETIANAEQFLKDDLESAARAVLDRSNIPENTFGAY